MTTVLGRAKDSLRREAIAARERMPAKVQEERSAAIRERLLGLDCWKEARVVGLYAAIRGEVDTLPLIETARKGGKSVVFPRVKRAEETLEFFEVESAKGLSAGAFEIPEPPADESRRVPIERIDLLVVPGVAFDRCGRRLGFGGGFYDRLLSVHPRPTVGLAYEFQIHPELPTEGRDRRVDVVVTESRWFATRGREGRGT